MHPLEKSCVQGALVISDTDYVMLRDLLYTTSTLSLHKQELYFPPIYLYINTDLLFLMKTPALPHSPTGWPSFVSSCLPAKQAPLLAKPNPRHSRSPIGYAGLSPRSIRPSRLVTPQRLLLLLLQGSATPVPAELLLHSRMS